MSKINAVRFININYNHDAIRISDEIMHFNGESTLISLQNGGGKSVLVQMLTAPFVQKRYRNNKERPFASYFTTSKPSFILVEWTLEQGAGHVLTGMMVRQSQNADAAEDLEIINFISAYTKPCQWDLHHLPVIETVQGKVNLKSYIACRQLFESYKKNPDAEFLYYDMNNSAQPKQYFAKLMEYGINYREWQNIIKKVNEEESGLSKLFADCRDEKGLVEKWFLYAVENKLNKDQNRIQEFRNILEKYISLYRANESKIKRRDVIQKFDEEAVLINEQGSEYEKAAETADEALGDIGGYILEMNHLLADAKEDAEKEKQILEEISEQIVHTDHEKHSAAYYVEEDNIDELSSNIAMLEEIIQDLLTQKSGCIKNLNLLKCAKQQETVNENKQLLDEASERLDVCQRRSQDLIPERNYLGCLLKKHTQGQLRQQDEALKQAEAEIDERNSSLAKAEAQLDFLRQQANRENARQGSLQTGIRTYEQQEQRFNQKWQAKLIRNMLGEYEDGGLDILKRDVAGAIKAGQDNSDRCSAKLEKMKEELQRLESTASELDRQRMEKQQELKNIQNQKQDFDNQLQVRRSIMQYLGVKPENIYSLDILLQSARGKIAELDAIVAKLTNDIAEKQARLEGMQTGRTLEIPDELQGLFAALSIPIVYGMEWMKKNGNSEEQNLALVKQHPFLPYALIMSEGELKRLAATETEVYTSFPIPIITREGLSGRGRGGRRSNSEDNSADIPRFGSAAFYMLFNNNLLNEERLAQLIQSLTKELAYKQQELENRKQEHEDYIGRRNILQSQTVTRDSYEGIEKKIGEIGEEIESIRAQFAAAKEKKFRLQVDEDKLRSEQRSMEKDVERLKNMLEATEELAAAYVHYMENVKQLYDCQQAIKNIEAERKKQEELKKDAAVKLDYLKRYEYELQQGKEKLERELLMYQGYSETKRPAAVEKAILGDINRVKARFIAVTENVSRELKELEQDRKRAADGYQKADRELKRLAKKYQLSPDEWEYVEYSFASEDHAEAELASTEKAIADKNEDKIANDKKLALTRQRKEQVLKDMQRDCETSEPLPREDIRVIDFDRERNGLVYERKEHDQKARELEKHSDIYNGQLDKLSEYDSAPEGSIVMWEEDFTTFSQTELRSFTGGLIKTLDGAIKARDKSRGKLINILKDVVQKEIFQDEQFKRPLNTLITMASQSDKARQFLKQLAMLQQSYHDLMAKLMVDIGLVEEEKAHIVSALQDYVHDVHTQMGSIDKNSTITVRGKRLHMLKIGLPSWEDNEKLYNVHVSDMVDDITKHGIAILVKNENLTEFLGKRLTTRELYDTVIGIGNINIQLYKIEAQRELQITWSEVARNSGGEGFLSAFVILTSLLYYMRRDETDIFADRNEGKVLLMDNPFAQTNASHLLKPLMEVAKKNNTQFIALTGLGGESIYNRFDNIYILNLIASSFGNVQYLKGKHQKGKEPETLSFARIEVADGVGQMESLF